MANARKLEELKCSKMVTNGHALKSALMEIEEKRDSFKAHLRKLNDYSSQFNGLDNAVKVIEGIT
jgi:hypothetical protein